MNNWHNHPDNPNFDNEDESFTSLDLSLIDNILVEGIQSGDYPDFSDAFISSADYDGREMTEDELEWLNDECGDFVHESVMNQIF